jgi:hypothetical protein
LQRNLILSQLRATQSMESRMFAAIFSRHQEQAAVGGAFEPAAFERWSDDEAEEQDHSLPVPWDWWTETAVAN